MSSPIGDVRFLGLASNLLDFRLGGRNPFIVAEPQGQSSQLLAGSMKIMAAGQRFGIDQASLYIALQQVVESSRPLIVR